MRAERNTRSRWPVPLSEGAYSLTEMLVVLAIIGIMAAIVIPQFAVSQKGAGLKGAATELTSALRTARRMAIAERELRALAIDIYSIPAEFRVMSSSDDGTTWSPIGDLQPLPNNIAIVSIVQPGWTFLDVTRTDDTNLDGAEDDLSAIPTIYNPGNLNGIVNDVFRLIRFYPTGTADPAMIYLWNITDERREIPNPTAELSAANLQNLGVPPGLSIHDINDQTIFFNLPSEDSEADSYYYTLVVNPLTGSVEVYDYAWGTGGGTSPNMRWDRKKDGD